ncbi:MAG: glycosyltransferase family 4 protein [Sphingobacteriales bacterium]|nr:glycosyltransferase family 4 protein [Sphingobacteriales bacterium]
MIKILVISNYSNSLSSRPEAEIFLSLDKNRFQLTVMTDEHTEYAEKFRESGIKVIHYIPFRKVSKKEIAFIRNVVKEGKYDIVHVFTGKAIINCILAVRKLKTKLLLYRGYTGNIHWYDPLAYLKYLHPRVDGIICNSTSVKLSIDHNNLFSKRKTVVITKGHDPSWYTNVSPADIHSLGVKKGSYVFITSGNARKMKGFRYLLKAMDMLPEDADIQLIIAGGDENFITKFSRKLHKNKEKVIFAGYRKDLLSVVAACDAFISSSVKGESFNKSLAEAIMLGKPAIITGIEGNKGMVIHEKTGLIVPARNARALADAMLQFYHHPEKSALLGIEGKAHLSQNYSFHSTVRQYEYYYTSLIDK